MAFTVKTSFTNEFDPSNRGVRILAQYIRHVHSDSKNFPQEIYAPYFAIAQSSGVGKSRLILKLMKHMAFTVKTSFTNELDPSNRGVRILAQYVNHVHSVSKYRPEKAYAPYFAIVQSSTVGNPALFWR